MNDTKQELKEQLDAKNQYLKELKELELSLWEDRKNTLKKEILASVADVLVDFNPNKKDVEVKHEEPISEFDRVYQKARDAVIKK